jgi:hypothetical protein
MVAPVCQQLISDNDSVDDKMKLRDLGAQAGSGLSLTMCVSWEDAISDLTDAGKVDSTYKKQKAAMHAIAGESGNHDERTIPALVSYVKPYIVLLNEFHQTAAYRAELAVEAMGVLASVAPVGNADAIEALLEILRNSHWFTRGVEWRRQVVESMEAAALNALASIAVRGNSIVLAIVKSFLNYPAASIRAPAIRAVGNLAEEHDGAAVAEIVSALSDLQIEVRQVAIESLWCVLSDKQLATEYIAHILFGPYCEEACAFIKNVSSAEGFNSETLHQYVATAPGVHQKLRAKARRCLQNLRL